MSKKVLILCRYFIPNSESIGWAIRMFKLSQFLIENDNQVYVVAEKGKEKLDYFGYENEVKKMNCTYVTHFKNIFKERTYEAERKAGTGKKYFPKLNLKYLKNAVNLALLELSVPDIYVYFIYKHYKVVKKLIEGNCIDNVIISGPPHSMQLVGIFLKKKYGNKINLIMDYRDSWNNHELFRKKLHFLQWLNEKIEELAVLKTDYITGISKPILEKLERKYANAVSGKLNLVMNGYDNKLVPDLANNSNSKLMNNIIKIGHFGSLKPGWKDPYYFIVILEKLLQKQNKFRNDFKFYFYGQNPRSVTDRLEKSLDGRIIFKDPLPHKEALKMMTEMDYLLILSTELTGADEILTGKIFEYLSLKKPVLVIGPDNMEVSKLVRENNVGVAMDVNNPNDMENKFKLLLNGGYDIGSMYNGINIEDFSRQKQYSKIIKLLK